MNKNKILAEFMGAEFINDAPQDYPNGYYNWNEDFETDYSQLQDFEFHENWNWLMPVVEKIESIHDSHHGYFGVYISSNSCTIQGTHLHLAIKDAEYGPVYFSEIILKDKLSSTYLAVVEFIEWYNTNLKK